MSNFPNSFDDDSTLYRVDDNITQLGGVAIDQLRSVAFAVEQEMGLGGSGTVGSVAARLGVSLNPDGTIIPSAMIAAGALVGQVNNAAVAPTAAIVESKLALTYSTQSLYNNIMSLNGSIDSALSLLSNLNTDFIKHLAGVNPLSSSINSRHVVSQIDINVGPTDPRDPNFTWPVSAPKDRFGVLRGSNLATFLLNLNNDLVQHELADGIAGSATQYGHFAAGIELDPTGFAVIPQTVTDVQKLSNYIDTAEFLSVVNHQQNEHTNNVSRSCRGVVLSLDGYGGGGNVIPFTAVKTYLDDNGVGGRTSGPVDNNDYGDDLIEFVPTPDTTFLFDSKFSLVKPGYIVTVEYGTVQVQYCIESVRFSYDNLTPPNRQYIVRIDGKNILDSATAVARIDKPLYSNATKQSVLALGTANNTFSVTPSLTVASPRGAMALGIGFDPTKISILNYNLYLAIYNTGDPTVPSINMAPIDITGNAGSTPGAYTLESIVEATNAAFRAPGYNYRFVAFQAGGEFGIALSDAINNVSFSIISGTVNTSGALQVGSYGSNVVGDASATLDPLGFGATGANLASPVYSGSFSTILQSQLPTKIFVPLSSKNYYVNGIERSYLKGISVVAPVGAIADGYADQYGDGYWLGTVTSRPVVSGTVKATYVITADLSRYELSPGKTILIQPQLASTATGYSGFDYGRFTISNVSYTLCGSQVFSTTIEVYN